MHSRTLQPKGDKKTMNDLCRCGTRDAKWCPQCARPVNLKAREAGGFVGYIGDRVADAGGPGKVFVIGAGAPMELDPRFDLRRHSLDGFQWGYGGSGPAQLALAMCANAVGEKRAQRIYQDFKFRVIARLPDAWELSRADVVRTIELLEEEINGPGDAEFDPPSDDDIPPADETASGARLDAAEDR